MPKLAAFVFSEMDYSAAVNNADSTSYSMLDGRYYIFPLVHNGMWEIRKQILQFTLSGYFKMITSHHIETEDILQ